LPWPTSSQRGSTTSGISIQLAAEGWGPAGPCPGQHPLRVVPQPQVFLYSWQLRDGVLLVHWLQRITTYWALNVHLCHWQQLPNLCTAQIANSCMYWIKGRDQSCVRRYHFISKLPTAVRDGAVTLKSSRRMGDGRSLLKNLRAYFLIN
jgi:hypothetical protein